MPRPKQVKNKVWYPPCFEQDEWDIRQSSFFGTEIASVCKDCSVEYKAEMTRLDKCAFVIRRRR
jgi:hypothetical protein